MRTVLLALVVLLLGTAWADDPPTLDNTKPPYERLLTGEDAKIAAALAKRIAGLERGEKYAEAVKAAKELAELRTRLQGEDHWQVREARLRVSTLEAVEALSAEEREKVREADQANKHGVLLFSKRKYAEAQPLFEKALAIDRQVLGEDHPDTAQVYHNLAFNLYSQGKFAEAQPSCEKALAIRRKVLGEEHPDTAGGYNHLAANLNAQRKVAEAQPLYEKALAISRKALGEKHPDTARGYNNLAQNLDAQRKYAEAQLLYEKALAICRKALGEEHPYTALGYNNLATNLSDQGKYAEAQLLYEKALAIRRKVQGDEHPNTATSCNDLAINLHDQGKYAEAQPLFEKALAIRRKVLGEEHPDTAKSYNGVAVNLQSQGKAVEAQPLAEKSLAIRRKVLGEEHPNTAASYNDLAASLSAQGKYAEAQLLDEKALAIRRKVQGDEHPDTAGSCNSLAQILQAEGKYAEAQALYEKALAIKRKCLGEEHPSTATGYNNLASNLQAQGKYAEAQPLYEKSLAICRKVLGDEHPATARGYGNLAANLNAQRKAAEAQPLYEKALAIERKCLGEEHPSTATGYNNVAYNLQAQGRYAEAQLLYEKSLAICRKVLGEEHPDTARGYGNLALTLTAQRKAVEAQPLAEKSLAIRRKVLGEEHPHTAMSYNNLAFTLYSQGKNAEAQPLYEKALALSLQVLGAEHPDIVTAYNNLAYDLVAQGKVAEALRALHEARRSYECTRLLAARGLERSIATGYHSPYPLSAALLAQQGRFTEAWDSLEGDLARGLLDQEAERRTLSAEDRRQQDQLAQRLAAIRARMLFLVTHSPRSKAEQTELEDLSSERRRLETDLADLAAQWSKREVADLADIRKSLPADAALVAWVDVSTDGFQEHWVCLVRATGDPVWERLPGTGPDNKWIKQDTELPRLLRGAVVGDSTSSPAPAIEVAALARNLHAQRLAPLDKHLKGVKSLVVVPVNAMSGVPVEALTDRFRISYIPSGTYLTRFKDRPRPGGDRVLALGDPRFDSDSGKPRPGPRPLPPGGLLVTQVLPNGSAAAARIVPDDVLLTYAGVDLEDSEQLSKLIEDKADAKTVEVTIWRDGKTTVRQVAGGRLGAVLSKAPAAQALAARREGDQLLASVRGGDWKELPGTRIELSQLTTIFGKDKVITLADVGATEAALDALRMDNRLKEFRYLHFATHGEANHVSTFESRLILVQEEAARSALPRADQPTLDGFLTAREVLEFWKLDADLVTLSACETALGRAGAGEGSIGFAQAFLMAGSRSVCLSLWKVDDSATALLMDRFYQNLTGKREGLKAPLGKAAALAEAKDWLRNLSLEEATERLGTITDGVARGKGQPALKVVPPAADPKANPKEARPFAHPRYWAAFVLIGDPN